MSAETDLLSSLKAYELGLYNNVQTSVKNGAITDKNTLSVLENIPYVGQILAIGKSVISDIENSTGAGSWASRMAAISYPLSGNILTKPIDIVKAAFSGRTFNSDQYYGASDYSFYVLGIDVGSSTHVKDSDVIPAMKWYIDKLGVFISGSLEVNALRKGVSNYIDIHKNNSYITTDVDRVSAARNVVITYMPYNYVKFQWKNTVGVYDNELISLAKQGYDSLSDALQAAKQGYIATGSTDSSVVTGGVSTNNMLIYAIVAIIVIIIILYTLK